MKFSVKKRLVQFNEREKFFLPFFKTIFAPFEKCSSFAGSMQTLNVDKLRIISVERSSRKALACICSKGHF